MKETTANPRDEGRGTGRRLLLSRSGATASRIRGQQFGEFRGGTAAAALLSAGLQAGVMKMADGEG
ncbi:MAG TPA: hypothetical protein VM943_05610 [Pyrinomonadaceae bacterium]|nr:hypothetical protein [Pyrinomonadaceae bacterium]